MTSRAHLHRAHSGADAERRARVFYQGWADSALRCVTVKCDIRALISPQTELKVVNEEQFYVLKERLIFCYQKKNACFTLKMEHFLEKLRMTFDIKHSRLRLVKGIRVIFKEFFK